MTARYKNLIRLVACSLFLLVGTAFADQAVNIYQPNSSGTVARGCEQVVFIITGVFTGTIGNATFNTAASTTTVIPIRALGDGKSLSEIRYTLGGAGTLIICETR